MKTSVPENLSQLPFRELLILWNRYLIDHSMPDDFDEKFEEADWLGFSPVQEHTIAIAEARLGMQLPPSYVEFLRIANGWAWCGWTPDFPGPLRPVQEVDWLRDESPDKLMLWSEFATKDLPAGAHAVYGEAQRPNAFHVRYLNDCLQLTDEDSDGGVFALNPEVQTGDGEWEAWHIATRENRVVRVRSFRELIEYAYREAVEDFG
jgi:hypothetical protein